MKKSKDYTITALLICFGLAVLGNLPGCYTTAESEHTCIDPSHRNCDAVCECDGMQCGKPAFQVDYILNIDSAGYQILTEDGQLVDSMSYGVNPVLDSIIDKDNL